MQTHHDQRHLHLQPASLEPWITFIQTRDLLCSALSIVPQIGCSVLFRQTDRHPSLRHAEPVQETNKAKRIQSNRDRKRRTPTPQSQPTHRYSTGNRIINTTRRPNPTQPRRNAPRPSTTARQSPISMDEASTYVRTHRYTPLHALRRIALQQKKTSGRNLLAPQAPRTGTGIHPRTWGDFSSIPINNPYPIVSIACPSIPCFSFFFVTLQDPGRPGLACIASLVAPALFASRRIFLLESRIAYEGNHGRDRLIAFALRCAVVRCVRFAGICICRFRAWSVKIVFYIHVY
jgi:hypothetical protein